MRLTLPNALRPPFRSRLVSSDIFTLVPWVSNIADVGMDRHRLGRHPRVSLFRQMRYVPLEGVIRMYSQTTVLSFDAFQVCLEYASMLSLDTCEMQVRGIVKAVAFTTALKLCSGKLGFTASRCFNRGSISNLQMTAANFAVPSTLA